MTAWMLVPIQTGPYVRARLFVGVDAEHVTWAGELYPLRPAEYADLEARLKAPAPVPATAGDGA